MFSISRKLKDKKINKKKYENLNCIQFLTKSHKKNGSQWGT